MARLAAADRCTEVEAARPRDLNGFGAIVDRARLTEDLGAEVAVAVVCVQVAAAQSRNRGPAVDIAADYGAPECVIGRVRRCPVLVREVEDRVREVRRGGATRGREEEVDQALPAVPSEVGPGSHSGARRGEVDLLSGVLTDVRHHQVSGHAVEAETPGVAQAVAPDRVQRWRYGREWVTGGNNVVGLRGRVAERVYAKDLAEQCAQVLGVAVLIVGATAVAGRDVEKAIVAEAKLARIVGRVARVRDHQEPFLRN